MYLLRKTIALIVLLTFSLVSFVPTAQAGMPPDLTANIAYAIDAETGVVLYEKNADQPRSVASLTKLMTAALVFEAIEKGEITWDTKVPISSDMRKYAYKDYSGHDFNFPEEESVWNLMHLLLIASSNVTASIFAEFLAGSEAAFVQKMNAKAEEMGLNATFQCPSGLKNSAVTARSIVHLAHHLYQNYPEFITITRQSGGNYRGTPYQSMNRLYRDFYYAGADGIKTGWTPSAGFSFLCTAERDGRRVIGVVIGSTSFDNEFIDGSRLLDYGFSAMLDKGVVISTPAAPATVAPQEMETPSEPENIPPEENETALAPLPPLETETNAEVLDDLPLPIETYPTSDWAKEAMETAADLGYDFTEQSGRGALNGSEPINRAEFAALLARVYSPGEFYTGPTPFSDLAADAWYTPYVATAFAKGIVAGTALDKYSPEALITREQVAVMIARPEGLRTKEIFGFLDEDRITPDMVEQVNAVAETGLMIGDHLGHFNPKAHITREEVTAIVVRLHAIHNPA